MVQERLRVVKDEFFELLTTAKGLDYFGVNASRSVSVVNIPERTAFDKLLCRRLAVASTLVRDLHGDPNFGRTKLAKLFYLADVREQLDLGTQYYREAAGPLDQRALYNDRVGIEALGQKYQLFATEQKGVMVRYKSLENLELASDFIDRHLKERTKAVRGLAEVFRPLDTDQTEIVATLFACWNDLLLRNRTVSDEQIMREFLLHWHPKKSRFTQARLNKALAWMKKQKIVPKGQGNPTASKPDRVTYS